MDVTIKQLRAFLAVAKLRNFRAASEKLAISQPALSIAIRQFEDALGAPLFDRTTRRVTLTEEGERFLPVAQSLLANFDLVIGNLQRDIKDRGQRVTIAIAVTSLVPVFFPQLLKEMSQRHPGIKVRLMSGLSDEVRKRILLGDADLGIVSNQEDTELFDYTKMFHDRLVVVARRDHPVMQATTPLVWSDLAEHQFIAWTLGGGMRQITDTIPELRRPMLQSSYEVSDWHAIEGLVDQGLGIAIVPWLVAQHAKTDTVCIRDVSGPEVGRDVYLISKSGRRLSPSAQTLMAHIVRHARDM